MLPESLQPYAKAAYPFLVSLLAVAVQWIFTGEYDRAELATQLTGLGTALLTLLVPNSAEVEDHEGEPVDAGPPDFIVAQVSRQRDKERLDKRPHTTLGTDVSDLQPA